MLVCLPPQQNWDGTWNDSNAVVNVFKPVCSGVNYSLSKFFSARITVAVIVYDLCDFFQEFCFVGHCVREGDYEDG